AAGAGHLRRARRVGRLAVDERAVRARQRDAGRCLVDLEAAGAAAGGVVVVAAVAGGGGRRAGTHVVGVRDVELLLEPAGAGRLGGAGPLCVARVGERARIAADRHLRRRFRDRERRGVVTAVVVVVAGVRGRCGRGPRVLVVAVVDAEVLVEVAGAGD